MDVGVKIRSENEDESGREDEDELSVRAKVVN